MDIKEYFKKRGGILNMMPNFVPRRAGVAGKRLKLHPDDYFALGTKRGSIKERWFTSVIVAINGSDAAPDEGLSYVNMDGEGRETFKAFVDCLGEDIIGGEIYKKHGTWPMYSKFFDYKNPLFHHLHLMEKDAARIGRLSKPEAYYYPPQYNNYPGDFPHTYFGFSPEVTKDEVKQRLMAYTEGDNRITELSRAYRIQLGTGWYTPPGVVHAPGSYLTYEPQWNSDVNSVYENVCGSEVYGIEMLNENCPGDKKDDIDYIMDMMDWEKNVDPDYRKHYFRPPVTIWENENGFEKWVVYGNEYVAAKELTVLPGRTVTVTDDTAYGCIFVQGHGSIGGHKCACATMLRFGQPSLDEFFVGYDRAKQGVEFTNHNECEPMVLLKHFPANGNVPKK